MQKLFLFFLVILISSFLKAQEQQEADLLLNSVRVRTNDIVVRSCHGSIYNKNPLFIIDGIQYASDSIEVFSDILTPSDIASVSVLSGAGAAVIYGSAAKNGVVVIVTKNYKKQFVRPKNYAFKSTKIYNNNWNITQDVYNSIQSKVPGVSISSNTNLSTVPTIRMRGDDNTIVIVDGIRYDASILNSLNPSNIESITVAPSAATSNYLLNN